MRINRLIIVNHKDKSTFLKYLFLSVLTCFSVSATISGRPLQSDLVTESEDYHAFEGLIVDSVEIDNRNIFDTSDDEYDSFLFRMANRLHMTTTKKAIAREVLLKKGSVYSNDLAEETSRILRERFILYDAWVEKKIMDNGNLLVRVVTIDQWSLSLGADIRREGNENTVKIGALERNLFGNNQLVSFHYIHQTEDDNYIESSFSDYRFFGNPLRLAVQYSNNRKSSFSAFSLSRPFYNLQQKFSYTVSIFDVKGRTDIYENSIIVSEYTYRGDKTYIDASYRFGSYTKKLITNFGYRYNYEKISDTTSSLTNHSVDYYPDDSLSHTVQAGLQLARFEFAKRKNIDGFNYTEDFSLGQIVDLTVDRTYNSKLSDVFHNSISFAVLNSFLYKENLFFMKAQTRFWFQDSYELRQKLICNFKWYNSSLEYLTFAFHTQYVYDYVNNSSKDLVLLGGTSGLRGYNKYFKTGDKQLILNSEIRFHPQLSILSVLVGGTLFADFGQIREEGQSIKLTGGYYSSVGGGLRIAFEKSSKKVIRLDLSYSIQYNWTVSIGTGMYFYAGNSI